MPRFVMRFSGFLSASSIAIAILVGSLIGMAMTATAIAILWG